METQFVLCELARNDALLNNYEPHLLLGNTGTLNPKPEALNPSIGWRALTNPWSVLAYLTKYAPVLSLDPQPLKP